jgi:hypothetical protein
LMNAEEEGSAATASIASPSRAHTYNRRCQALKLANIDTVTPQGTPRLRTGGQALVDDAVRHAGEEFVGLVRGGLAVGEHGLLGRVDHLVLGGVVAVPAPGAHHWGAVHAVPEAEGWH